MEAAARVNRGTGTTHVPRPRGARYTYGGLNPPTQTKHGYNTRVTTASVSGRAGHEQGSTAQEPEAPWVGAVGFSPLRNRRER